MAKSKPQFVPARDLSTMRDLGVTEAMMKKMDLFYRAHPEAFGLKEKK